MRVGLPALLAGETSYELLGMLCGAHHDLVTHQHHEIVDFGDGTWSLRAPPEHGHTDAA